MAYNNGSSFGQRPKIANSGFGKINDPSSACFEASLTSFGPSASACQSDFDFTLLFEQSVLSIPLNCVFLLILLPRLLSLWRLPIQVRPGRLLPIKVLMSAANIALRLSLLVEWSTSDGTRTIGSVPSAVMTFFAAFGLALLSYFEHLRSIRPSTWTEIYLLMNVIVDAVQLRTLYLQSIQPMANLLSAGLGLEVLMLVLESSEKQSLFLSTSPNVSPEAWSGIFSRSSFFWLNKLFWSGARQNLTLRNLYELDYDLWSTTAFARLKKTIAKYQHRRRFSGLLWLTLQSFWTSLALSVLPRLALIGFDYAKPLIYYRILAQSDWTSTQTARNQSYGLIAAIGIAFVGSGVCSATYQHQTRRAVTQIRGALIALIFEKTLLKSPDQLKDGAAVALITSDIEAITGSLEVLHTLWGSLLESILATYLLYAQIGKLVYISVVLSIICCVLAHYISTLRSPNQRRWLEAVQKRIASNLKMLQNLYGIKMTAYYEKFYEQMCELRRQELIQFRQFLIIVAVSNTVNNVPFILIPFLSLVATFYSTGSLFAAQAFTAIAIFNLLSSSLAQCFSSLVELRGQGACFDRLESYCFSTIAARDSNFDSNRHGQGQETELSNLSRSEIRLPTESATDGPFVAVKDSSFIVISGPTGCGKSRLLRKFINQNEYHGRIAYCSSTAWLMADTIRENITMNWAESDTDNAWYETVIRACALDEDIRRMEEGHETKVGSGGGRLSGGQKQRVALARALFARRPIVVLDDVFSGLDGRTMEKLYENLFTKSGLLRRTKSTVILATHDASILALADEHFVMTPGTGLRPGQQSTSSDNNFSTRATADLDRKPNVNVEILEVTAPNSTSNEAVKEENQIADLKRGAGDTSLYLYLAKLIGLGNGLTWLVLYVLFTLMDSLPTVWVQRWTTALAAQKHPNNAFYIGIYAMLTAVALLLISVCIMHWFGYVTIGISKKIYLRLLHTIMQAKWSFLVKHSRGEFLNRFSEDISIIDHSMGEALYMATFQFLSSIVNLVYVCIGASLLATAVPVVLVILFVLQMFYLRTSRQLRLLDIEAKAPLVNHFTETVDGVNTIRAFGFNEQFVARQHRLLDDSQKAFYYLQCIQRWLGFVLSMITAGLAILLTALAMQLPQFSKQGFLGIALISVLNIGDNLTKLVVTYTAFETSLGAIARLKKLTQIAPLERSHQGARDVAIDHWPPNATIEYHNVSAGILGTDQPILRGVSLSFKVGEKIGICGRTGSGKSSMLLTLLDMLEIYDGNILVDGKELASMLPANTRANINTLPQEALLIPGSIKDNLNMDDLATPQKIVDLLKRLSLLETVEWAGGLDADIEALQLSHGQKQLFCLARAVLSQRRIVILDEATSHLDAASDKLVQELIQEEFAHCTILAVAHRISNIVNFDRIVVMDGGQVVEFDSPQNLLRRDNSLFKALWSSQNR